MIWIKNLLVPGILCLFFPVCSRKEPNVFSQRNIWLRCSLTCCRALNERGRGVADTLRTLFFFLEFQVIDRADADP